MPFKQLDGRFWLTIRLVVCLLPAAVVAVLLTGCAFSGLATSLQAEGSSIYGQQQENAKESAVKENIHTLQVAIATYAVDHNDTYPPKLTRAILGMYIVNWPKNPYNIKAPVTQGTDPGDYTYTTNGSTFKLVGRGKDGEAIITVP